MAYKWTDISLFCSTTITIPQILLIGNLEG